MFGFGKVTYVAVCFGTSNHLYHYRADSVAVAPGDIIIVPTPDGEKVAVAVSVKKYSPNNAPYPVERTKSVVRKASFLEKMNFKADYPALFRKSAPKKAYWTQRTHLFRADEFICSACKHVAAGPKKKCPYCGAIMKNTKYDPNWVDEIEFMEGF